MFKQQHEFMQLLQAKRGFPDYPMDLSKKESQKFVRNIAYETMGELFEAVFELKNRKEHRATEIAELDREKLLEELVDAFHFFAELLILMGVTPDEFFDAFMRKGQINVERINGDY
jgi:hypothetical protein